MKLGAKLILLFGLGFAAILLVAALGLPRLVASVGETQLMAMARTIGGYLVHDLETLPFGGDEAAFEKTIDGRFEFVASLGTSTDNFRVNKIILVDTTLHVEVGHPDGEMGADYSGHPDIREAFGAKELAIVLEAPSELPGSGSVQGVRPGGNKGLVEADIVAPVHLADGDVRVLEVKLDFSATLALLSAQYNRVLAIAAIAIAASLVALVGALLLGVRRTVVVPLLSISEAMERVGGGDLEATVEARGRDEIAAMARHFNSMTHGLRERFELERYVSRSTVDAAKVRAVNREAGRGQVERKVLTVFFSDVRGFTSYSERTDPARVIEVLNSLLGAQEEIVRSRSGYVDKFVGDETMAVFEKASDAVDAALAVQKRIAAMSDDIDALTLGIGIHLGELVEGDMGSPRMMNHTVIGDTVNVAARLQAAATPGQVIVSRAVAAVPSVAARYRLRALPPLRVKGKGEALDCSEVLGPAL